MNVECCCPLCIQPEFSTLGPGFHKSISALSVTMNGMFSIPFVMISHFGLTRFPMQSTRLPWNLSPWQRLRGFLMSHFLPHILWKAHGIRVSQCYCPSHWRTQSPFQDLFPPRHYSLKKEEDKEQGMGQNWSRGQLLIPCLFLSGVHLKVETFKQFKYGGTLSPVTSKYAVIGSKVFSIYITWD